MKVAGVIPPMVTPMTETGEINIESLRTYTEELVQGGVHGLLPVGSTGEFSSLTREQRASVIETVVDRSGTCPVLAGCGGTSLENVRRYLADAAAAGADAGVVVTPYFLETTQASLSRYYERLADDTPLPIYIYNIPQYSNVCLTVETVTDLADRSEIVGMKDSTADFAYFVDVLNSVPDSFNVLQGSTILSTPSIDYGADGLVAGPANIFPGLVTEFYEEHQRGDRARIQEILQSVIAPIITAVRPVPASVAFKYLLSKDGLEMGEPLVPLPSMTESQRNHLDECYQQVSDAEASAILG